MTIEAVSIAATFLGTLASVIGIALAYVQSARIRDIRRRDENDLWDSVWTALSIIGDLESSKMIKENRKVSKAYTSSAKLHRLLLKQLALREKNFDQNTIDLWKNGKKIRNSYQEKEAQRYIDINKKSTT